ncbi:MAG: SGNH/GDSL hydrolase family protein [Microbacterium ginsengisoli]|nr:SGNH/GDSL hydrolase family protein [Microbacterium ginsengisoli]
MDPVTLGMAKTDAKRRIASDARVNRGRLIAVGDSITETNSSRLNNIWGNSWVTFAVLASAGRLTHIYTCAKGGANTTTVRGLWNTEVVGAGLDYDLLAIADGTNDTAPLTETLPNNQAMIDHALGRGARVVVATIPPAGSQAVTAPADFTLTALPGYAGGTLPAGTYYYQIVTRTSLGQSTPTVEKSVTLSAVGAVRIDWTPAPGATGYSVWGRTTGASKPLVWQNGTGTAQATPQNTFTDTGAATTAATMPSANTTASAAPTDTVKTKIATVNGVKRTLARRYGIPVIDQFARLHDWSAGRYKPGLCSDGTHPTTIAERSMGVTFADAMVNVIPVAEPELCRTRDDPLSMLALQADGEFTGLSTRGLLYPKNTGDNRPANWSWYGDTATAASTLTTDPNVDGYVYTITRTAWSGAYSDISSFTDWTPGDLVYLAFKLKTAGLDAIEGGSVTVAIKAIGSTGATYLCSMGISRDAPITSLPGGWAVWRSESRIPAGTTSLQLSFGVVGAGVSASIAQMTVRNLTRLGLS